MRLMSSMRCAASCLLAIIDRTRTSLQPVRASRRPEPRCPRADRTEDARTASSISGSRAGSVRVDPHLGVAVLSVVLTTSNPSTAARPIGAGILPDATRIPPRPPRMVRMPPRSTAARPLRFVAPNAASRADGRSCPSTGPSSCVTGSAGRRADGVTTDNEDVAWLDPSRFQRLLTTTTPAPTNGAPGAPQHVCAYHHRAVDRPIAVQPPTDAAGHLVSADFSEDQ